MKKNKVMAVALTAAMSLSVLSASVITNTKAATAKMNWQKDASKKVKFNWYIDFSWFTGKWGRDETTKYITKKTGVDINYVIPSGNEQEKFNTMLASGALPDLITTSWSSDGARKLVANNLVYPLDDLAKKYDKDFNKVASKDSMGWYKQDDGHTYGYPNYSVGPSDTAKAKNLGSNNTFLVRKDIYDAIGKPNMTTPAGFLKALELAKKKFPKVSGQSLIPFGCDEFQPTAGSASIFRDLAEFLAIPYERNGKLIDRNIDPEMLIWMKTFSQASRKGLVTNDIFIDKRSQTQQKIDQGRYFSILFARTDLAQQLMDVYKRNPKQTYIAVDAFMNSKKQKHTLGGAGISGWTQTFITKSCKNPKRAIEFFTYMISDEGQKDNALGPKSAYTEKNGKAVWTDKVMKLYNNDRAGFDNKIGANGNVWQFANQLEQVKWLPATTAPYKQLQDWTKQYVTSFAAYGDINPPNDSPEGQILTKYNELIAKLEVNLMTAKSDKEFDKIVAQYKKDRDAAGYAKLIKWQEKKVAEHKKKLGLK